MPRRILDTNILLNFWNHSSQKSKGRFQAADARRWARQLISFRDTNAILTPIYIEVLAGVTNAKEAAAWETFLAEFVCVDQQQLLKQDWQTAIRFAKRIPRNTRRRKLGDCLIRALSERLGYEIITNDKDFRLT